MSQKHRKRKGSSGISFSRLCQDCRYIHSRFFIEVASCVPASMDQLLGLIVGMEHSLVRHSLKTMTLVLEVELEQV